MNSALLGHFSLLSLNSSPMVNDAIAAHYPTDESALKVVYLALQNISKKWTMPIKDWKAALNRFAIAYEDRFPT